MVAVQQQPTYTLGEHLRKARLDAEMEQADLADALDVSRQLISKWERNVSVPSVIQYRALARVTGAGWLVPLLNDDEVWAARDSNPEPADSTVVALAYIRSARGSLPLATGPVGRVFFGQSPLEAEAA